MKKNVKIIGLTILIIVSTIFVLYLIGKVQYQAGGKRGFSQSLEESKNRGVFIKELSYKISPQNLEINSGYVFFIERGFIYGKNSIYKTDSLSILENRFPYQLVFGCKKPCDSFKSCNFDCKKGIYFNRDTIISLRQSYAEHLKLTNKYLKDTVYFDVLFNEWPSFKVDTIGTIKVWDDNTSNQEL